MTNDQPVIVDDADAGYFSTNACAGWPSARKSVSWSPANAMGFRLAANSASCNPLFYGVLCAGGGSRINTGLGGGAADGGAGADGGPGAPALQGGWQAVADSSDGGVAVSSNERLRFEGNHYVLVSNAGIAYCGEVGTFQASATSILFAPDREDLRPCQIGDIRQAALVTTASAITLTAQGTSRQFSRNASVPKMS